MGGFPVTGLRSGVETSLGGRTGVRVTLLGVEARFCFTTGIAAGRCEGGAGVAASSVSDERYCVGVGILSGNIGELLLR